MLTASEIIEKYISFFEKRGHKRIANSPLVPQNDPTTLFTSSGMQPLIPYLMGQEHPQGVRLVDVQNAFRAVDIEEVGDNRHTTFFRMLGNWSLGDYFKKEEIPWLYEFLIDKQIGLGIDQEKLHFTVFKGYEDIPKDTESYQIWEEILQKANIKDYQSHLHWYGAEKNWWSRSGTPDKMPVGEIGGPDTEIFYDFSDENIHKASQWKDQPCHVNCDCGRYWEIANSVFMQYKKNEKGEFEKLPKQNVDFGGGLERLLGAAQNKPDIFQTSLFKPTIECIEKQTDAIYSTNKPAMQIIADHLGAAIFIANAGILPSKTDQGYILRRLIRRALDNFYQLKGKRIDPILEAIVNQYKITDPQLETNFERIKYIILEEEQKYGTTRRQAEFYIEKKYKASPHVPGYLKEISAEDAFILYTTHGLSPTQIKSLGYIFNDQEFAQKMEEHQNLSRKGAEHKFKGGLADHAERTIMGHTATHLMHQALRDVLGDKVHQTGSNITTERIRFDFNYDKKLTDEEIEKVEKIVNEKIKENLPVHFEIMTIDEAKKLGAIGLFMDTYGDKVKIYFIGDPSTSSGQAYSIEFCGGPHVDFTGQLKSFKIIKQENLGSNQKRLYAKVDL
ncbi:MAG TPA: alanine--tRNA ligase [Patescibacteria group bacterium]|nr:alanine--tRNA ligase [Patescibacteria group bacterium]